VRSRLSIASSAGDHPGGGSSRLSESLLRRTDESVTFSAHSSLREARSSATVLDELLVEPNQAITVGPLQAVTPSLAVSMGQVTVFLPSVVEGNDIYSELPAMRQRGDLQVSGKEIPWPQGPELVLDGIS
jgi:hypothetical protein